MSKGITWRQTLFGDATMTSCAKAMKLMQPLMDGELDEPARTRVLTHLESCVDCGLKYETYLAIKRSVAARGRPSVDEAAASDLAAFATRLMRDEPPLPGS